MKRTSESSMPAAKKGKTSAIEPVVFPTSIDKSRTDKYDPETEYLLYFDGGCRNNGVPGKAMAGYGCLIKHKGIKNYTTSVYIGKDSTNNEAEYLALLAGLRACQNMKFDNVVCVGDSLLVINQMRGYWKVNAENIRPIHAECVKACEKLKNVRFCHIPRALNTEADKLANDAMDLKRNTTSIFRSTTTTSTTVSNIVIGDQPH